MMPHVALAEVEPRYPRVAPYDPSAAYPEYPFQPTRVSSERNDAYDGVRRALALLGLDREHLDTSAWNPLGGVIRRGDTVVVKPNWVYHELPGEPHPEEILVTHPAVIRAVLDYVYIACGPSGRIILGDAPIQGARFDEILRRSHIADIQARFVDDLGVTIDVIDLRSCVAEMSPGGRIRQVATSDTDAAGFQIVDVGEKSFLEKVIEHGNRFRSLDYDPRTLRDHHGPGRHCYKISRSVLEADAFVNVPKLKTHGKTGVTLSLKNLVGINGDKAYLPHFRTGSPRSGGDDYPFPSLLKWSRTAVRERLVNGDNERLWKLARWLGRGALGVAAHLRRARTVAGANPYNIFSGHWFGNDTTWRMVLDLNLALMFAGPEGAWCDAPRRGYISIADGIVSGQNNGPLQPQRHNTGAVLATHAPVAGDYAAAWLMGFDPERIPLLAAARRHLGFEWPRSSSASDIQVATEQGIQSLTRMAVNWRFHPPDGWVGQIERELYEHGIGAA